MSDHIRLDERSLTLHRLIAEKVLADPALLAIARDNLRRWQEQGADVSAFDKWREILSGPAEQVAAFLAERSERATRLRQSSPFPGILTEAERLTIFDAYRMDRSRCRRVHRDKDGNGSSSSYDPSSS